MLVSLACTFDTKCLFESYLVVRIAIFKAVNNTITQRSLEQLNRPGFCGGSNS
jgi:hypothetical protein